MKVRRSMKRLLSLAVMLCMILAMSLPVFATNAAAGNPDVEADKSGVLNLKLGVEVKDKTHIFYTSQSSGFLVNDQFLVTCYHSIHFNETELEYIHDNKECKYNKQEAEEHKKISVFLYRDQSILATVKTESAENDLAVLKLDEPIQNRTYLKLYSGEAQSTSVCYSLGFPGIRDLLEDNKNTVEDVVIEAGAVSSRTRVGDVSCIMHSAKVSEGCSGGPVVNYAGNVIGITDFNMNDSGGTAYYYAVDVSELKALMNSIGIVYTEDDRGGNVLTTGLVPGQIDDDIEEEITTDTTVDQVQETANKDSLKSEIDESNRIDKRKYKDDDKMTAFEDALKAANDVQQNADATQKQVDDAERNLSEKRKALNRKIPVPLPAIIAIAAAVIILVIVIIMLKGNGGKKPSAYDDVSSYDRGVPVGGGPTPYGGDMYTGKPDGGTTVLGGGGSDTTVLGGDSGATTVLSGGASYGSLTRTRNGERIPITREQFKIGRERSRVDYCINDNTAVGRLHAIIVSRGGSTFVVDQNSTNCTFVNSVRATANQEIRLNSGDKVTFADEEFTFNAF